METLFRLTYRRKTLYLIFWSLGLKRPRQAWERRGNAAILVNARSEAREKTYLGAFSQMVRESYPKLLASRTVGLELAL